MFKCDCFLSLIPSGAGEMFKFDCFLSLILSGWDEMFKFDCFLSCSLRMRWNVQMCLFSLSFSLRMRWNVQIWLFSLSYSLRMRRNVKICFFSLSYFGLVWWSKYNWTHTMKFIYRLGQCYRDRRQVWSFHVMSNDQWLRYGLEEMWNLMVWNMSINLKPWD